VRLSLSEETSEIADNRKSTLGMKDLKGGGHPNYFYISRIKKLIALAEASGKKVIFYSANNILAKELLILSDVIPYVPKENLLSMPDGIATEVLFKTENIFDDFHLNEK